MTSTTGEPVVPRRDRLHAATEREIATIARRQLVEGGGAAPTLRGIAREMGMTAPALYRYVASLDDLLDDLREDIAREVDERIGAEVAAAGDDRGARLCAGIRGFRAWAVAHPAEFGLMFRSRALDATHAGLGGEPLRRVAGVILGLFADVWRDQPFDAPEVGGAIAASCLDLAAFARAVGVELPDRALWVFATAWIRLSGVISMEVLGHLGFLLADVGPYFEAELASVARDVGITEVPPGVGRLPGVRSETMAP